MKKLNKDIIIVGFALFAMFFGAGNLLFPPFLGLITGKSWLTGFYRIYTSGRRFILTSNTCHRKMWW